MDTKLSQYAGKNHTITTGYLGRLVRRIFPAIQKVRKNSTDENNCAKRIHLYEGISFVSSPIKLNCLLVL